MPAQWTGEVVGKMHNNKITGKMLAAALGWNDKYLSQILNGKKSPAGAEAKVRSALDRLISGAATTE